MYLFDLFPPCSILMLSGFSYCDAVGLARVFIVKQGVN